MNFILFSYENKMYSKPKTLFELIKPEKVKNPKGLSLRSLKGSHSPHISILKLYHRPNQKFIEAPLREPITQWSHAVQCMSNAKKRGYSNELVISSLLHDIGHFLVSNDENNHENMYKNNHKNNHENNHENIYKRLSSCVDINHGDDHHEMKGAEFLKNQGFPLCITEPIRFHAVAKYEKCMLDKDYKNSLSPASKQTLSLQVSQGVGFMNTYLEFKHSVFYKNAMMLREVDDESKKILTEHEIDELASLEDIVFLMKEVLK
jgi:predicted HD phosphohydrolase